MAKNKWLILLAAAGVSFLTALWEGNGDFVDPIIILLILFDYV